MTIDCGYPSLSHYWSADDWDWPLQFNEQMVRIENTRSHFRVLLDVRYFAPNEIQVKAFGEELLWVHCKQNDRDDTRRSISREFHRAYRLPDGVDTTTLKFLLRRNGGVLLIEAQKKKRISPW